MFGMDIDIPNTFIIKEEEEELDGIINQNFQNPSQSQCSICLKWFSKSYLSTHLRTIHLNHRPFLCGVCHLSFKQRVHLNQHLRVHFGLKPYKCPKCEGSFTQQNNLDSHLRTKHKLRIVRRTYWRRRKNKNYTEGIELRGVLKMKNPKMPNSASSSPLSKSRSRVSSYYSSPDKKFRCKTCYMKFPEEESLMNHRKVCGMNTPEVHQRRLMKWQQNQNQLQFGGTGSIQKMKIRRSRSRQALRWAKRVGSRPRGGGRTELGSSQGGQEEPRLLDLSDLKRNLHRQFDLDAFCEEKKEKESVSFLDKQKKDDINLWLDQVFLQRDEVLEAPKQMKQIIDENDYKNGVRYITKDGKKLNFVPSAWWFKCRICERCVPDKDKFVEHMQTQHANKVAVDEDDDDEEDDSDSDISSSSEEDTEDVDVGNIRKILPFMNVADDGKYSCSQCPETFSYKAHLLCHSSIVHTEIEKTNESGPQLLRCGESGCEKVFRLRRELASHTWIHTGEQKPSKPTPSS